MRYIPVFVTPLSLTVVLPVGASSRAVPLYLDGTRVESELPAPRGYLDVPLPAGFRANSLRITPRGRAQIARVEVVPARADRHTEKEIS